MDALTFFGVSPEDDDGNNNANANNKTIRRGRGRPRTLGSKPPRFFCAFPDCSYGASTKHRMTEHQRTHFDTKTQECFHCHKVFKSKASLAMHTKKHLGLKPAKCGYCEKRFSTKGDRVR